MEPCKHKTVEPSCPKCMKDKEEYELRCAVINEAMGLLGPHWSTFMNHSALNQYLATYIEEREPQLKEQLQHG